MQGHLPNSNLKSRIDADPFTIVPVGSFIVFAIYNLLRKKNSVKPENIEFLVKICMILKKNVAKTDVKREIKFRKNLYLQKNLCH